MKGATRLAQSFVFLLVFYNIANAIELKPGDMAPDFFLEGSDGKSYRLSDQRGTAVVIAWFPKTFTRR